MTMFTPDKEAPILVEFSMGPGLRKVSRTSTDITAKSREAVDNAMNGIHNMADRLAKALEGLAKPPSEVEVSFGIKFDAETGAIIAKAGVEASVNVRLNWKNIGKSDEKR